MNDIWLASFKGITFWTFLLSPVIFKISTIPHAKEGWEFSVAFLLTQKKTNHFQVNTYDPPMLIIFKQIHYCSNIILLLFQHSGVTNRNSFILIPIVQKYTFEAALGAVQTKSPLFWVVATFFDGEVQIHCHNKQAVFPL